MIWEKFGLTLEEWEKIRTKVIEADEKELLTIPWEVSGKEREALLFMIGVVLGAYAERYKA